MILDFLVCADFSDSYDRLVLRGIDAIACGVDDAFTFVADAEDVVEFEVLLAGNLAPTVGVLEFLL